jgi:small subunit ribosomal protein S12
MSRLSQTIVAVRTKKTTKADSPKLAKNPQKKAICLKVLTISPKKPNSANRRIIKARLVSNKIKLAAKIPGESHNLQQHSIVLIAGARVKDLIGISYSAIRGKFDLLGVTNRKNQRSLYGVKKTN